MRVQIAMVLGAMCLSSIVRASPALAQSGEVGTHRCGLCVGPWRPKIY